MIWAWAWGVGKHMTQKSIGLSRARRAACSIHHHHHHPRHRRSAIYKTTRLPLARKAKSEKRRGARSPKHRQGLPRHGMAWHQLFRDLAYDDDNIPNENQTKAGSRSTRSLVHRDSCRLQSASTQPAGRHITAADSLKSVNPAGELKEDTLRTD